MGVTIVPDVEGEDNVLQYSHEGTKVKRCFKILGLPCIPTPGSDCSGTLYQMCNTLSDQYGNYFPQRGDPHPSIIIPTSWGESVGNADNNAFCADVFHFRFIDPEKIMAEVEYNVLNGLTQEPSADNDQAEAWLQYYSSVQMSKINVDYQGNQLLCAYRGQYQIFDNFNNKIYNGALADNGPQSLTTADANWPNIILQFQRRMTTRTSPASYMAMINSLPITFDGNEYDTHELLCVRNDAESLDGGFSFINTLQLQFRQSQEDTTYSAEVPGWDLGDYFRVQCGYAYDGTNNWQVAQTGQIPTDCQSTVFQIQDEIDFNDLNLGNG